MADKFDIGEEIITGTKDVFSTMLMVDLQSETVIENRKCDIQSNLTSMIGLGGGIRGVLAIHCPAAVAKEITGAFLGMDVSELDDDVKDAIGEIANMVAGNLKVSYGKIDINIELAIPTSIVGKSFSVSGVADARRVTVPLAMGDGTFWVELMYVANK
ncbi:MAG: chemotaxis protein CheX [Desulforhopalus sp.]